MRISGRFVAMVLGVVAAIAVRGQGISASSYEPTMVVPDSVAAVVGEGGEPYLARLRALHELGPTLSPSEVDALCAFLYRKPEEEKGVTVQELNSLKNEVVNLLRKQAGEKSELIQRLIALQNDTSQDAEDRVWRVRCPSSALGHRGARGDGRRERSGEA